MFGQARVRRKVRVRSFGSSLAPAICPVRGNGMGWHGRGCTRCATADAPFEDSLIPFALSAAHDNAGTNTATPRIIAFIIHHRFGHEVVVESCGDGRRNREQGCDGGRGHEHPATRLCEVWLCVRDGTPGPKDVNLHDAREIVRGRYSSHPTGCLQHVREEIGEMEIDLGRSSVSSRRSLPPNRDRYAPKGRWRMGGGSGALLACGGRGGGGVDPQWGRDVRF